MIVKVNGENVRHWAKLCAALWPDNDAQEFLRRFESGDCANEFIYMEDDRAIAFLSLSLRHDYVEGTHSSPVGYVEGIYVAPDRRGQGIARQLVEFAGNWSRQHGCSELASDCSLENEASRRFHGSVGFLEANTIVCFTMRLS